MTAIKQVLALLLSVAGITSMGASSVTIEAQAQEQCHPETDAACACDKALEIGTIEALEDYLYRFPQHDECWFRIHRALRDFSPDRDRRRIDFSLPPGGTPTQQGYGG